MCVCFFLSMGTPVSQHLTSGLDTERRKKGLTECVGESKTNKKKNAPIAVARHGSSNILPARFSEQWGSRAFDISGGRLVDLRLVSALALARAVSLYMHAFALAEAERKLRRRHSWARGRACSLSLPR